MAFGTKGEISQETLARAEDFNWLAESYLFPPQAGVRVTHVYGRKTPLVAPKINMMLQLQGASLISAVFFFFFFEVG